ncbi:hypothetical protein LI017_15820, partial [Clostridium perfringens]|nr:hypothetical protein [Clostridium perfringens]
INMLEDLNIQIKQDFNNIEYLIKLEKSIAIRDNFLYKLNTKWIKKDFSKSNINNNSYINNKYKKSS